MTLPANTPWLVVVFVVVFFGPPALASKIGAQLPGFLGALGRWWQARKNAADESPSDRVANREIKRLSESYDRLDRAFEEYRADTDRQLVQMRGDIADLTRQLTAEKNRFWAAIGYVRVLRDAILRIDPSHPIPEPPALLTEYLGA